MSCPYCHADHKWKWNRTRWMRFTPGHMRNWRCSECGHEFIRWLGFICMKHATAHVIVVLWHWLVAFAILLGAAWFLPTLFQGR